MTDFLQTPNKLFNNKRRHINKSKQKTYSRETNSRKAIIRYLNNSIKKNYESLNPKH